MSCVGSLSTVARWLPACLLAIVAVNQLRLAHTERLSPWSGGGFGMFSSTDSPSARHLHVLLENADIVRGVAIPEELAESALRAAALPSPSRLRILAQELAAGQPASPFAWTHIQIQVWAVHYDQHTLLPSGRLLTSERVAIDRP